MQTQLNLGCGWARAEPDNTCSPFNRPITEITRDMVKVFYFLDGVCDCHFRCAYLVGNVQEYITLSLELMGRCILSNLPVSEESLLNIILILHYKISMFIV